MVTVGKTLQYFMFDLQLEPVIAAAAVPECELIRDMTSCIKLVKERTSLAWQAGRPFPAKR